MSTDAVYFSLIRYQPDMQRQEVVNVGVVLFLPNGPVVSFASNQGKLLALDPNIRITQLFEHGERLQAAITGLWSDKASVEEIIEFFGHGGTLSLTPPGLIDRQDQSIETIVDGLLRDLVVPPAKQRVREQQPSRLHTELRQLFRQANILGAKPDDIHRHLVVPNYPIDPEIGLFAEFAIRNGKLHVTETVDFRTRTPSGKKQEAQSKTLLLVEALEKIGASDLRRYVVITGASAQVQSSMNLLSRFSDDLIVRESGQDWRRYVDAMYSAAKPDNLRLQ